MKKRPKPEEGGASWMDTYGDMVTLLLCFFVLLYTISNVDQEKFSALVQSLNPDAMEEIEANAAGEGVGAGMGMEESDVSIEDQQTAFENIYERLIEMAAELGIQEEVDIYKGDGYTFISFRDKVFFDGDSYVLKEEGRKVLDSFCEAVAPASASIKEMDVLGHTSQGDPEKPNEAITDRMLSAQRSAQVAAYIQRKEILSPEKLVSSAYGQWRPIDSYATKESRARNRRAEILITKDGAVERSLDEYYEQIYGMPSKDSETAQEQGAD